MEANGSLTAQEIKQESSEDGDIEEIYLDELPNLESETESEEAKKPKSTQKSSPKPKQRKRSKLTPEALERNRVKRRLRRAALSEEAKLERRKRDTMQMRKRRQNWTAEKLAENRKREKHLDEGY